MSLRGRILHELGDMVFGAVPPRGRYSPPPRVFDLGEGSPWRTPVTPRMRRAASGQYQSRDLAGHRAAAAGALLAMATAPDVAEAYRDRPQRPDTSAYATPSQRDQARLLRALQRAINRDLRRVRTSHAAELSAREHEFYDDGGDADDVSRYGAYEGQWEHYRP